jgi:hypothetical protein
MDFQSKLRELTIKYKVAASKQTTGSSSSSSLTSAANAASSLSATILSHFQQNDLHVPMVHVNNKFELFDTYLNSSNMVNVISSVASSSTSATTSNMLTTQMQAYT